MFPRKRVQLNHTKEIVQLSRAYSRDEVSTLRRAPSKRSSLDRRVANVVRLNSRRRPSTQITRLKSEPSRSALDQWIKLYGMNTTSHALLEGPKSYFTSREVDGFIAFQISGGVAVIGGDPMCSTDDAPRFLRAFLRAMKNRPVAAYQVSPHMLWAFRQSGFRDVQIGKEAIFDLHSFTLKGGAMELVRAAVNKARRAGVVVREHKPLGPEAEETNAEIREVSEEWLRAKGNCEMGFLLGSLELERPSAKRYFVARSERGNGRVEGFIVCSPIYGRNGYYLDITRRRNDAVRGTMELLTTDIFAILRTEGYQMASMGLAPLALLDDEDLARHPRLTRLMRFIYDRVSSYDFKFLYRYKAKYHPQTWEPRYLCFNRKRLTMRMAYAVVRVRRPFNLATVISMRSKETKTIDERIDSFKRAASFVVGLCWTIFWSSS